ncbi:MAG: type I-C CRISPR-associated protein Cas8c/Csd1, partial [Verrucomicrobiota bacterium]
VIPLKVKDGKKWKLKRVRRPYTDVNEISVRSLEKAKSYFLCDTVERVLLYTDKNVVSTDPLLIARSRFFLESIKQATAKGVAVNLLGAVISFLESGSELESARRSLSEFAADPDENIVFGVEGADVMSHHEIMAYWREQRRLKSAAGGTNRAVCLVTGELADCVSTANKIKGIGGQDTILISANEQAFASFGLDKAANSPISVQAEGLVKAALDDLICKSKEQRLVFNETIHLHWTRKPIPKDPFDLIAQPDEEAVKALIESVKAGRKLVAFDVNDYYALSLSANGARIVIRDWLETSVQEVESNIARWFQDLAIIDHEHLLPKRDFSLWGLLAALVPRKDGKPDFDKLAPQAATELLYAALNGGALPQAILFAAIRRHQLEDNKINPARLALIKACLIRSANRKKTDIMKENLDPESKDRAYLCGQLFAVIGRLQLLALGKVGASIAERTYGGVATRPATTFGPLFTKLPAYLKKANTRFPGSGTNKQKEIENLSVRVEAIGGIPQTLGLEDQGRFALGYYCQLAQYRTDRAEAEAAKKAEELADESN